MSDNICRYCGKEIGMDDYRTYTIVQHEDETCITLYLHALCIEMDSDHWMIRTLESHSELKNTQYDIKKGTESPATSTEDRNPESPNTSAGRTANEGEGVGDDTGR